MLVKTKSLILMAILAISSIAILIHTPSLASTNSTMNPITPSDVFTGRVFDKGIDTDGNGLFDWLEIRVEVDVNRSGVYSVSAYGLKTITSEAYADVYVSDYVSTEFDIGLQNATLRFYGPTIQASHLNDLRYISSMSVSSHIGSDSLSNVSLSRAYSYSEFDSAFTSYEAILQVEPDGTVDMSGFMNASHLRYPVKGMNASGDVNVSTIGNSTTIEANAQYDLLSLTGSAWPYSMGFGTMVADYSKETGDLNVAMNSSTVLPITNPYYYTFPGLSTYYPYPFDGSSYPWNSSDFTLSLSASNGLVNGQLNASTSLPSSAFSMFPFNATDMLLSADYAGGRLSGNITVQILPNFPLSDVLMNLEATRQGINIGGQVTVIYGTYPLGGEPLVVNETYVDELINKIMAMEGIGPGSLFNSTNGLLELDPSSAINKVPLFLPSIGAKVNFNITLDGDPVALIAYTMAGNSYAYAMVGDSYSRNLDYAGWYRIINATLTSFGPSSIRLFYDHESGSASLEVTFTDSIAQFLTDIFTIPDDMTPMAISGYSMFPTLQYGDLVIAENIADTSLIVVGSPPFGDIIFVRQPDDPNTLVVTRAINTTVWNGTRWFATKGDNNHSLDQWYVNGTWTTMVPEEFIVGKVVEKIPYLGLALLLMEQNLFGPHPRASVRDILSLFRDTFASFKSFNIECSYESATRTFNEEENFSFSVEEFRSKVVQRYPDLVDPAWETFARELLLNYYAEVTSAEIESSYHDGMETFSAVFVVEGDAVREINHIKSLVVDEYFGSAITPMLLTINSTFIDPSHLSLNFSVSESTAFFGFEGFRVSPPVNVINATSFTLHDFFNLTTPESYYQPSIPGENEVFKITLQGACNGTNIVTIFPSTPAPAPDYESADKTLVIWNNCSVSNLRYVTFVLGYCTEIPSSGQTYRVISYSNGTVSQVTYDPAQRKMSLTVEGPTGETGYINMSIPSDLLDANSTEWAITVDGRLLESQEFEVVERDTQTFLYFTFNFGSPVTIEVVGTVPEFPAGTVALLLSLTSMLALLGAALERNRRMRKNRFT